MAGTYRMRMEDSEIPHQAIRWESARGYKRKLGHYQTRSEGYGHYP